MDEMQGSPPATGSLTVVEETPPPDEGPKRRWFRYALPGAWVALVFVSLSFTPSLLPRSGLFQGILAGITAAIGYGLGVAGAWVWREFADREPKPPRPHAWRVFAITAVVVLVASMLLGLRWQRQIRELMGAPDDAAAGLVLMPLVGAVVFVLVIAIGRALRATYRWFAALLDRWIGQRAARVVGWLVVAATFVLLVNGVLIDGLMNLADRTFAVRDTITAEGIEQPDSPLRSGSPDSLVAWDSLGRQGRTFTGSGPTVEEIAAFNGSSASEPIRVFAGTASADDAEARADLAVRDLDRAGGFTRQYLMVATTTGSGWLVPSAVDSFEYITGGDSAIVAIQYSHLPSWISYLVDQEQAREAGRALFDAVYERWAQLPAGDRPELVVFGESLGSFGGETAFSGEHDLANRTNGALFVGPPSFNILYREFTDGREQGSTEVEPVYKDGRIVRFTNEAGTEIRPAGAAWNRTRVLYLQHPSDPIVWWSPDLIVRRPDWLEEARGRDVLDEMAWIPFVTFWQITADLPMGLGVPAGHGHNYTGDHVDGWAAVLQPDGWSSGDTAELREIVMAEPDG